MKRLSVDEKERIQKGNPLAVRKEKAKRATSFQQLGEDLGIVADVLNRPEKVEPVKKEVKKPIKKEVKQVSHELRISPKSFNAVDSGFKNYDIRRCDKDFRSGDKIVYNEYDNEKEEFSVRRTTKRIGYITRSSGGLKEGFVILGLL